MIRTILWFIGMGLSLLLLSPWAIYYKYKLKHIPGAPIDPGVEKIIQQWARWMLAPTMARRRVSRTISRMNDPSSLMVSQGMECR